LQAKQDELYAVIDFIGFTPVRIKAVKNLGEKNSIILT
jgi:hypothetical protein